MMCAVHKCDNNVSWKVNLSYYNFPKDPELLQKWILFCNRSTGIKINTERVCKDHFTPDDFERNPRFERAWVNNNSILRLKPDAVPSVYKVITEDNKHNITSSCQDCIALRKEMDLLTTKYNQLVLKEVELLSRIISLEEELKESNPKAKNMREKLGKIFTQSQIEMLCLPALQKQQNWVESDIIRSINLYSVSTKAYKLLRKNDFPLPSVQTLQSWAQSIELSPGVLKPVVKILKETKDMNQAQKVCLLVFAEMKVKRSYCYNKCTDSTSAPADYVQVAMLRGLMSKWEQPIFYSFDCKMNWEVLTSILKAVEDCGYIIVALVSDLEGENSTLYKDLNLSLMQPWFFYNGKKIFVFPDVPHLLEQLVNNFFDHGFLMNGIQVQKNIVSELLSCKSSASVKINIDNLYVSAGVDAAKHFSQSIARDIGRAASLSVLKANWAQCYKLFQLTNEWFDIMNVSRQTSASGEDTNIPAYGQALSDQNMSLQKMSTLVLSMRVIGQTSALPFQAGIAFANVALKHFFKDLSQRFGFEYILTNRLHKDALENTLEVLGTKRGLQRLPNQEEFRSRLTSHILGHNEIVISDALNESPDDTKVLQAPLTAVILKTIAWPMEDSNQEEEELNNLDSSDLKSLAEYICQKLRNIIPEYLLLDDDGLSKPSQEMMNDLISLDNIFKLFNKENLVICVGYQKVLSALATDVDCPPEIKAIFFRAKMFWRIKELNRNIVTPITSISMKRKYNQIAT